MNICELQLGEIWDGDADPAAALGQWSADFVYLFVDAICSGCNVGYPMIRITSFSDCSAVSRYRTIARTITHYMNQWYPSSFYWYPSTTPDSLEQHYRYWISLHTIAIHYYDYIPCWWLDDPWWLLLPLPSLWYIWDRAYVLAIKLPLLLTGSGSGLFLYGLSTVYGEMVISFFPIGYLHKHHHLRHLWININISP